MNTFVVGYIDSSQTLSSQDFRHRHFVANVFVSVALPSLQLCSSQFVRIDVVSPSLLHMRVFVLVAFCLLHLRHFVSDVFVTDDFGQACFSSRAFRCEHVRNFGCIVRFLQPLAWQLISVVPFCTFFGHRCTTDTADPWPSFQYCRFQICYSDFF